MAYVATTNSTSNEDKKKAINISESATGGVSGGTGTIGPSTSPSDSGMEDGTAVFNDYLQANQEGSKQLGSTVQTGVNKVTSDAGAAVNKSWNDFNAKANAGYNQWNEGALQYMLNKGKVTGENSGGVYTVAPTVQKSEDDFNKLISGTYTGPKTWEEAGLSAAPTAALLKANQTDTLTDTNGGRKQLLQEYITRSLANTTGNLNLNSGLLNGTASNVSNIRTAGDQALTMNKYSADGQAAATSMANQVAEFNKGMRDYTVGRVGSYLNEQDAVQRNALLQAQYQQQLRDSNTQNAMYTLDFNNPAAARDPSVQNTNRIRDPYSVPFYWDPNVRQPIRNTDGSWNYGEGALFKGWESTGVSREQAQQLSNLILQAEQMGQKPNMLQYYTTARQVNNVTDPAEAQRLNALAQIAGVAPKYTGTEGTPVGQFDYNKALAETQQLVNDWRNWNETNYNNQVAYMQQKKVYDDWVAAENAKKAAKPVYYEPDPYASGGDGIGGDGSGSGGNGSSGGDGGNAGDSGP